MSDVTLKEHIEALLREKICRLEQRMDAMDEALELATREKDRRLGELNNLRREVMSDRSQFVRSDVYGPRHDQLDAQLATIDKRLTTVETRSAVISAAIGLAVAVAAVVLHFWKMG